jgi:hypothetical protein
LSQTENDPSLKLAFDRQRIHSQPTMQGSRDTMNSQAFILDRDVGRASDCCALVLITGDSNGMAARQVFRHALFSLSSVSDARSLDASGLSNIIRYAIGSMFAWVANSSINVSMTNALWVDPIDLHCEGGTLTFGWCTVTWRFGIEYDVSAVPVPASKSTPFLTRYDSNGVPITYDCPTTTCLHAMGVPASPIATVNIRRRREIGHNCRPIGVHLIGQDRGQSRGDALA